MGGRPRPPLLILLLTRLQIWSATRIASSEIRSNFKGGGQRTARPTLDSSRMNRSNTSFDSNLPRGVRRMTSPSSSRNPDSTHSAIVSERASVACVFQTLVAILLQIDPAVQTQTQKESLLQRSLLPANVCFAAEPSPATYSSSESGVENRTASCVLSERQQHRMRIHAESQIRLACPILQIVPRLLSRTGEVRDLVLPHSGSIQTFTSHFV